MIHRRTLWSLTILVQYIICLKKNNLETGEVLGDEEFKETFFLSKQQAYHFRDTYIVPMITGNFDEFLPIIKLEN